MFITFEGPEGSGKTTQINRLANTLEERGLRVLQTREPGGTDIGEEVRDVLHDPENTAMNAITEILLFSASRAQLTHEVIRPALEAGQFVVCDRYYDSTLAYQGYGRGLDLEALKQITAFATGGLKPDLTLYLDIEPEDGLRRRQEDSDAEWTRLDDETLVFHQRVYEGYRQLMEAEPERWVRIDASRSTDEVAKEIESIVIKRLAGQA